MQKFVCEKTWLKLIVSWFVLYSLIYRIFKLPIVLLRKISSRLVKQSSGRLRIEEMYKSQRQLKYISKIISFCLELIRGKPFINIWDAFRRRTTGRSKSCTTLVRVYCRRASRKLRITNKRSCILPNEFDVRLVNASIDSWPYFRNGNVM